MLAQIEALEALRTAGTMSRAGLRLRVSQSAVSKRIATLEQELGEELLEKTGRRVTLTPAALRLLERLQPVLVELRAALRVEDQAGRGVISLGVSESILASWGAGLLADAAREIRGLEFELHAHRSPAVVERVVAGEYLLGIIAGEPSASKDLHFEELVREAMVLIPCGLRREQLPARGDIPVMTIEAAAGTWSAISRRAKQVGLRPERRLESFFAVAQLAIAGFGHGLVPLGVAEALGLQPKQLHVYPLAKLSRPVYLVARRTAFARPLVQSLVSALRLSVKGSAVPRAPRRP